MAGYVQWFHEKQLKKKKNKLYEFGNRKCVSVERMTANGSKHRTAWKCLCAP